MRMNLACDRGACMFTVLLVENDEVVLNQIKELLNVKISSIQILRARNGMEAFDQLKKHQPALILMDISLPDGNGLKLIEQIQKFYPNMKIIVNTNYDSEEYRLAAVSRGVDHFLSKKFNTINDVIDVVEHVFLNGSIAPKARI